MSEAISAISMPHDPGQAWESLDVDPQIVARFERAFSGEGDLISPLEGELFIEPKGPADSLLQNFMNIDRGYHEFFSEGVNNLPMANLGVDRVASSNETSISSGPDALGMREWFEGFHVSNIKRLFWFTQVSFNTSIVSAGSGSLMTMLKSNGG